ncbi:MAG: hypothetical protein AAF399_06110, partial [Bacteroidota bacterium]
MHFSLFCRTWMFLLVTPSVCWGQSAELSELLNIALSYPCFADFVPPVSEQEGGIQGIWANNRLPSGVEVRWNDTSLVTLGGFEKGKRFRIRMKRLRLRATSAKVSFLYDQTHFPTLGRVKIYFLESWSEELQDLSV